MVDKITDEDLDRIEGQARDKAIVSALETIASKSNESIEALLKNAVEVFGSLAEKETPVPDVRLLALEIVDELQTSTAKLVAEIRAMTRETMAAIKGMNQANPESPKSFRIERNKIGLIDRIVVETEK